jgi:hypothetical protein
MKFNPATVGTLSQLMQAGLDPGRGGGPLHCRLRYFDPENLRAGIPQDTAALIDHMTDSEVGVTLVNVSQSYARTVAVQLGAYGEHQCQFVTVNGEEFPVDRPWFQVRLEPGSGARLVIQNQRYANAPRLALPWSRE